MRIWIPASPPPSPSPSPSSGPAPAAARSAVRSKRAAQTRGTIPSLWWSGGGGGSGGEGGGEVSSGGEDGNVVGSWKDREEGYSSKSEPQDLSTCLCHADGRGGGTRVWMVVSARSRTTGTRSVLLPARFFHAVDHSHYRHYRHSSRCCYYCRTARTIAIGAQD